ncbi:unnamed protein product [Bemisia tabaci]|uniref:Uncharacterized protein n=1 Tax=Bemisia tabaci TaxID=7038 RepID=A0A9P0A015_BEMTA|nr:unnamed protein product [Bemisia tabaci]
MAVTIYPILEDDAPARVKTVNETYGDYIVAQLNEMPTDVQKRKRTAKPGKYEINFGTLVDEFKNIEVQRQSALKGMLQNPDVTRSNRTAKFLEVARELDTAFMQIRIYCDAAQVVFKTTNFTHPDNNFLQIALWCMVMVTVQYYIGSSCHEEREEVGRSDNGII